MACPDPSTATQNVVDGHDTLVTAFVPSITTGDDHLVPLKREACPSPSTAMQNVVDGHETLCSWFAGIALTGPDHPAPLYEYTHPSKSATALQNVLDRHAIAVSGLDES